MSPFLDTKTIDGKRLLVSLDSISYVSESNSHGEKCYSVMFTNGYGRDVSIEEGEKIIKIIKKRRKTL